MVVLVLTYGEMYCTPQRVQPGLRPEQKWDLTMKSMKGHEEAVAEFRSIYIRVLVETTIQPFQLALLSVWPKAKSLHVPSCSSW